MGIIFGEWYKQLLRHYTFVSGNQVLIKLDNEQREIKGSLVDLFGVTQQSKVRLRKKPGKDTWFLANRLWGVKRFARNHGRGVVFDQSASMFGTYDR